MKRKDGESYPESYLLSERNLMANRLRKIRVKIWTEIYDNRSVLDQSEFESLDEACLTISSIISNLLEGESNEESD